MTPCVLLLPVFWIGTALILDKLSAVTAANGAAALIGHRNRFVSLLKQKLRNEGITPLPPQFHCIMYQEHLCVKTLQMENIHQVVKETVNCIQSRGLQHRQCQTFLAEINSVYKDVDDALMLSTAR